MSSTAEVRDWAILPYNSARIKDRYLVSNMLGSWDLLTDEELKRVAQCSLDEHEKLFERLHGKGIIVKDDNFPRLINEYRNLNSHLFKDASLHIAVLTTRCNIACRYCQTRVEEPCDMSYEVAKKILDYCLGMRSSSMMLEFQGGEPLLNWDILKFFVEHIKKFNLSHQTIRTSLVTNGVLLDDEKIDFLVDHGVGICISLDGPQSIHDQNRVFGNNAGTYECAREAISRLKAAYDRRGMRPRINLIPTLGKESLTAAKEIIDEYVGWGVTNIALRPVNSIGGAQCQWDKVGYSAEEFNQFWAEAMDYILALNKKGIDIKERMAAVMLTKILKKQNPGYVDLMSPCGAGRSTITYMPNGDIYPCDEARMTGNDMFKLGSVFEHTYEDVIKSPKLFSISESSVMDLWDYGSAFLPWMGTCPVLNFMTQGNLVPKITQTPKYKVETFQLTYLFEKMVEDKEHIDIFNRWVS